MFPEKLIFSENVYRTAKLNEALLFICPQINELHQNKSGAEGDIFLQPHRVTPPGVEPGTQASEA